MPTRNASLLWPAFFAALLQWSGVCGEEYNGPEDTCGKLQQIDFGDVFKITPLSSGVYVNDTMCPQFWRFYSIKTKLNRQKPISYLTTDPLTGIQRTMEGTEMVTDVAHAINVHVEGYWMRAQEKYSPLAIMVVNGEFKHQWNTEQANEMTPAQLTQLFYPDGSLTYVTGQQDKGVAALTLTVGFNRTIPDQMCKPKLEDTIHIAIGCKPTQGLGGWPCYFKVAATALPEYVFAQDSILTPIGMGEWHNYHLQVGDFDIVGIDMARVGVNLTYDYHGELMSNYHGLQGDMYVQRTRLGEEIQCPTNESYLAHRDITNLTTSVGLDLFCTVPAQAGWYTITIKAFPQDQWGYGYYGNVESENPPDYRGYIGPYYQPLYFSPIGDGNKEPNFNLNVEQKNDFMPAWGNYRLVINHKYFHPGEMKDHEQRAGCISYGQWRYYTIKTTGVYDATIRVDISQPVTGVYVRANAPPNMTHYSGLAKHPTRSLALSPCDVFTNTTWYIGLYMATADETGAQTVQNNLRTEHGHHTGGGTDIVEQSAWMGQRDVLNQTEFTLTIRLENASMALVGGRISSQADGGDGYVCCGAFKYYVVDYIPEDLSLHVQLNVTKGKARAMYLKHGQCPAYPADIDGDTCRGWCHVLWYTIYGMYSGKVYNLTYGEATVPYGMLDEPDKRRGGLWYIGIQANDDEVAEYEFVTSIRKPPPVPVATCDRYSEFCAEPNWMEGTLNLGDGPNGKVMDAATCFHCSFVHVVQLVVIQVGTLYIYAQFVQ